ncbi:MAG: alkaline phosphatase [Fimbriimonadia bacterium]|nr:alkaline phosphatase [Fimbriimonadia bacterium]
MDKMTRRDLLRLGAAAGIGTALTSFAPAIAQRRGSRFKGNPKNIIFMVSDGMSAGVPSLSEAFSRSFRGKGSFWHQMLLNPEVSLGYFDMESLNSLVTDSSSASSSWGTGSRIVNGAIGMLPDGTRLTPIAVLAKEKAKKKVGLVTTTRMTHATPAGFATVQARRDDEDSIAPQYLNVVDVLLGGGLRHFAPDLRGDKRDLLGEYKSAGYEHWSLRDQLMNSKQPDKVLGLFWRSHLPYTVDQINTPAMRRDVPTLAEMTRAALDILSRHKDGFLLQVEGGRVDHAAHANDAAGLFFDQMAFEDAMEVAVEFARKRGDTLVIVTSDHGNANPGLNGLGYEYGSSDEAFTRLLQAKMSFEELPTKIKEAGGKPDADTVRDMIKAGMAIEIEKEEAQVLSDAIAGKVMPVPNKQHRNLGGLLGGILSNYNGIGWIGMNHTADYVWVSAFGPGQEQFEGLVKNTDAFVKMTRMWGINFKNPSMTREQAKPFMRALSERVETPHWA